MNTLAGISAEEWSALAGRQVFFGHQSVGRDVVAGIGELLTEQPRIGLTVEETRELHAERPALRHAAVGRNDHPGEKIADFASIVAQGLGPRGIAMLKLCYADFHVHTDVPALFGSYQRAVAELRASQPGLTIVHCTVPLTITENWKGRLAAAVKGHHTERDRNAVRHRYNELLRGAVAGSEPVFDIARLESTLPDGTGCAAGGVPQLVPGYTNDGGHLNTTGRRLIAERLLVLLARLS